MLQEHKDKMDEEYYMILYYGYLGFIGSCTVGILIAPVSLLGFGVYCYTCYLQLELFHDHSRNILLLTPYFLVLPSVVLVTLCLKNVILYHKMIPIEMTLREFVIEMQDV